VGGIYEHYVRTAVATFDEEVPPPEFWSERLDLLNSRGLPFLVASADSEILGYTFAAPWKPRFAYRHTVEDSVYLAQGATGQGLGTVLLGALLDGCGRAGIHEVIAVIADGEGEGKASVALHRRFGFAHTGVLQAVGFKFDRWLDTTLMQRSLTLTCPRETLSCPPTLIVGVVVSE
jgi:L-amino acid N-acyltransferase YncA